MRNKHCKDNTGSHVLSQTEYLFQFTKNSWHPSTSLSSTRYSISYSVDTEQNYKNMGFKCIEHSKAEKKTRIMFKS